MAEDRRQAYLSKARAELAALEERGVLLGGNAFSSVLLLKGEPSAEELAARTPLSGADGTALRAALAALGYAPEDWCCMLTVDATDMPLAPQLLREAIATLDPATLIACDEGATQALRDAYANRLAELEDFEEAMLAPGKLVRLLGMRVLNLGGFAAALADPHEKQIVWRYLKQVPQLGAPY